ncbi:hypothetical protein HZB02_02320 [Candidatus Woesearchaeota archaeon]|nr:hypothetical protein [Candidatus Woesearchaeota archaeon]
MKKHDKLAEEALRLLKGETLGYQPNPSSFEQNRKRAGYGLGGLVALTIIPGPQPLLGAVLLGYSAIKGYQAYRDYHAK